MSDTIQQSRATHKSSVVPPARWVTLRPSRGEASQAGLAVFVLRIALAVVILPHGLQKLFGWFGGYGFVGTMNYFTDTLGIPYAFGLLAIAAEVLGALALLAGALTRIAASAVGTTLTVAMLMVHAEHGFFMNWFGNQQGEGIEYFLLAISIAGALVLTGGGWFSVDRWLTRRDE